MTGAAQGADQSLALGVTRLLSVHETLMSCAGLCHSMKTRLCVNDNFEGTVSVRV